MKTVLDDLLETLPEEGTPVRHVLAGAHWTVVCSRGAGMAATLMPEKPHGHASVHEVGHLHEKPARALAELARSSDLLEASIGVAAINSLLTVDELKAREINAADVLASRGAGRNVALIGHFPFIDRLRPAVGQLWVIEQHPLEGEYPADAAAELLPKADVVAITGSALINHTPGRAAGAVQGEIHRDGAGSEHAALARAVRARCNDHLRHARGG